MEKKYIVGIDVGSQSAKVFIYDLAGKIVAKGMIICGIHFAKLAN